MYIMHDLLILLLSMNLGMQCITLIESDVVYVEYAICNLYYTYWSIHCNLHLMSITFRSLTSITLVRTSNLEDTLF